jgi:LEA14-like dessication related protein
MRMMGVGAVGGVAVTSTGCATLLKFLEDLVKVPALSFTGMHILEASLSTITARFDGLLTNPNPFGIHLDGLDYVLHLAGAEFARGNAPQGIDLRPGVRHPMPLDVQFDLGKTAAAVLGMIQRRAIDYKIDTVGHFKIAENDLQIPAGFGGSMPMPQVPAFDIHDFRMKNAGITGVGFTVLTSLMNSNPFDIPIDALKFDVKLGGRSVVTNHAVGGLHLPANKKSQVPFEFAVNPLDLGLSLAEMARAPNMAWEVGAELASGLLKLPFTQRGNVRLG